MLERRKALVTALYGLAVVLSGLYRYFMESGGEKGLWFGLVMGGLVLVASWLQSTRRPILGDVLALLAVLFVGGWFSFENFAKAKHELRMYLMIFLSIIELAVLVIGWLWRQAAAPRASARESS